MSIRMDENSSGVSTLTLPETYTLFELEQAPLHLVFGLFTQLVNGLIDRFVCFQ